MDTKSETSNTANDILREQVKEEEVGFQASCGFNAKGVDTKSETSHTANDILRKVKKHVPT